MDNDKSVEVFLDPDTFPLLIAPAPNDSTFIYLWHNLMFF